MFKKLQQLQQKYDEPIVDYGDKYLNPNDVDLNIYPDSIYFWLFYDKQGRIKRCGVTENIKKTVKNMIMQTNEYYISIHEVIVEGSNSKKLRVIKDYKQQLRRILCMDLQN